jgi:hypothetical protein
VHLTKSTVGRVAAWIYGTDLLDACLGALLASAIRIPVLGVPLTCFALAITAFAGLVLLLLQGATFAEPTLPHYNLRLEVVVSGVEGIAAAAPSELGPR